jgi:integrase
VTVSQARDIAREKIGEIVAGKNPQQERRSRREELTVGKLFDRWVEEHARYKRKSWQVDKRRFRNHVAPHFGNRSLRSITSSEVLSWHRGIGEKAGKVMANQVLTMLSCMYNWAYRVEIHDGENPCKRVGKFPETSRTRFLQPDELPRFFEALKEEPKWSSDFFTLAILTGARKSNLCMMRWDQIVGNIWTIPGGDAKSGRNIEVPLVNEAAKILESRREETAGSAWVFPGRRADKYICDPYRAWERIRTRAGLCDVTVHDLRRSYGSYQALAGSSLLAIGRTLGHSPSSGATQVYARLTTDSARQSAERGVAMMMAANGKGADDGEAS